jgi:hypothetical protein
MSLDLSKFHRNYYFSSALDKSEGLIESELASEHQKGDHQRGTPGHPRHAVDKHVGAFCLLV